MNKLMNCIKKVLEKKEIKQTWLANKPGKSFHIVNSNVCNYRQPSLEVRFKTYVFTTDCYSISCM